MQRSYEDRWTVDIKQVDVKREIPEVNDVVKETGKTALIEEIPGASVVKSLTDSLKEEHNKSITTDNVDVHIGREEGLSNIKEELEKLRDLTNKMSEERGTRHSEVAWDGLDRQMDRVNDIIETVGDGSKELANGITDPAFEEGQTSKEFHHKYVSGEEFSFNYDPASADTDISLNDVRPINQNPGQVDENIEELKTEFETLSQEGVLSDPTVVTGEEITEPEEYRISEYEYIADEVYQRVMNDKHLDVLDVQERMEQLAEKQTELSANIENTTAQFDQLQTEVLDKAQTQEIDRELSKNIDRSRRY